MSKTVSESKRFRQALVEYRKKGFRSTIGAESAWRGFDLQALYICSRVMRHEEDISYLPETVEDLLIIHSSGAPEESREFIQVKSMEGSSLTLSTLNPQGKDSFFGHLKMFWRKGFSISARIVVFGEIGKEMSEAAENLKEGGSLRRKLVQNHGYTDKFCDWLKDNLAIESVDETQLENMLLESLSRKAETAASPKLARENLKSFIHTCCKDHIEITARSWQEKINSLGVQMASERNYIAEFGATIVPFAEYIADATWDYSKLEKEYREGIGATPLHIAAEIDMPRPRVQSQIGTAFDNSNIVIVRGASGQGKTTACYRWLLDNQPTDRIYLLNGITTDNSPQIAAALRGLSSTGTDVFAYIEATSDRGWVELCEELERINGANLKLLVSVREDDAARAGLDRSRISATNIPLTFSQNDAKELYSQSKTDLFPSFKSSWNSFGESGPLMEYAYSLNHDVRLREKLESQVNKIRMEDESWLTFLYLASRAGEYGLPSSIAELKTSANCRDVQRMLATFEDEMLLRSDEQRELVFPLHPHRAKLLSGIIEPMLYETDEALALKSARCSVGDFSPILIPYLDTGTLSEQGIEELSRLSKRSWESVSYAIRAMLWKDARRYYRETACIRQQIKSIRMPLLLGTMARGNITKEIDRDNWRFILDFIRDEEARGQFEEAVTSLGSRLADCRETDRLLSHLAKSLPPANLAASQPSSAGFVLAYIGDRGFGGDVPKGYIEEFVPIIFDDSIALDGRLDLLVGCDNIGIKIGFGQRQAILMQICQQDHIAWIGKQETEPSKTTVSEPNRESRKPFSIDALIVPPIENEPNGKSKPNDVVMKAVYDLRKLFPECDRFHAEYVGIRSLAGGIEIPDTKKNMPKENLHLNWLNLITRYNIGMCELEDGVPDTWGQLEHALSSMVSNSVRVLEDCSSIANSIASHNLAKDKLEAFIARFNQAKDKIINTIASIPLCSRSPFAYEDDAPRAFGSSEDFPYEKKTSGIGPAFEANDSASPFKSINGFRNSLLNHFNPIGGMLLYIAGQSDQPKRIAVSNIAFACAKIDACNEEFARLFDGKTLVSKEQKKSLIRHGIYWNYLYTHRPNGIANSLQQQIPRMKKLQEFPGQLIRNLKNSEGVIEAFSSPDRPHTIEIDYRADADAPFAKVMKTALENLYPDLQSEEYLFESIVLKEAFFNEVKVTYLNNGRNIIKQTIRFDSFFNPLNDAERINALSTSELLIDENSVSCQEEAFLLLSSLRLIERRLFACRAEVDASISEQKSKEVEGEALRNSWVQSIENMRGKLACQIEELEHRYSGLNK